MNNKLAPIVLFVYNRPDHTKKTLEALSKADLIDQSELIIFSDGPKSEADISKVEQVRELVKQITWTNELIIHESEVNKGLTESIISGVSQVINEFGKVIVLEDDLDCHPFFLKYMNYYLEKAENDLDIIQISGYIFKNPVNNETFPFKIKLSTTWGWATWKNRWSRIRFTKLTLFQRIILRLKKSAFNLNDAYDYYSMKRKKDKGEVESWGIDFWYYTFANRCYVIYPPFSLIQNLGLDGSGTNKGLRQKTSFIQNESFSLIPTNELINRQDVLNSISFDLKNKQDIFV